MASYVQKSIKSAIKSLNDQDIELAEEIIKNDDVIDGYEVEIEKKCIRMIALYQPEAENIAERSILLAQEPPLKPYVNLTMMAEIAHEMVEDGVISFLNRDTEIAKKVIKRDDMVDELYHQLERELITYVMEDPRNIRRAINLSFVARHFERIADHAENIAEAAIYWAEGEMIKHKHIKEAENE